MCSLQIHFFPVFPGFFNRGLCWKGLDCHLGKQRFGTPLGCVGTKDSRILYLWISQIHTTNFGARFYDGDFPSPASFCTKKFSWVRTYFFELPVDLCDVLTSIHSWIADSWIADSWKHQVSCDPPNLWMYLTVSVTNSSETKKQRTSWLSICLVKNDVDLRKKDLKFLSSEVFWSFRKIVSICPPFDFQFVSSIFWGPEDFSRSWTEEGWFPHRIWVINVSHVGSLAIIS